MKNLRLGGGNDYSRRECHEKEYILYIQYIITNKQQSDFLPFVGGWEEANIMTKTITFINQRILVAVLTIVALAVGQSVWARAWKVTPYCDSDTWDPNSRTLTVGWSSICNGNVGNYADKWEIEYIAVTNEYITTIPEQVFSYNINLKSVSLARKVNYIQDFAFMGCKNLKSVVYTCSEVPNIAAYAFAETPSDMKIYVSREIYDKMTKEIGTDLPVVGAWIDDYCAVTLEGNALVIRGVGNMAEGDEYRGWSNNKENITSGIIEQGVRSIGSYTFSNCTNLTSVTIPDYLETICTSAFAYCKELTTVTLPASMTHINNEAFYNSGLTTLYVQSRNAPMLGSDVFKECNNLTTVVVPAGSDYSSWSELLGTKLKPGYFITCEEGIIVTNEHNSKMMQQGETATLSVSGGTGNYVVTKDADGSDVTAEVLSGSTLTMPAYDITVRAEISGSCGKTTNDNVTWTYSTNTHTLTISGTGQMADYDDTNQPWVGYKDHITNVVIEEGVTSIGSKILYEFLFVTSVSVASSVTKIGAEAFCECKHLTEFTGASGVTDASDSSIFSNTLWIMNQPEGMLYIGHVAYYVIGGLTTVVRIADGTTQIGDYAFMNSNIREVFIPASVTNIKKVTFDVFLPRLQKIWFLSSTPPVMEEGVFKSSASTITDIYVPAASLSSYSSSLPDFSEKIRCGHTVTCGMGINATTPNNIPLVLPGETVTLSVEEPAGYTFNGYSVKDADNDDVTISETNNVCTFTMPNKDVTVNGIYTMSWTLLQNLLTYSSTDADNPTVITLCSDVVAESTDSYLDIPPGHHVIIDLDGHTINRNMTEAATNGNVFYVRGGTDNKTPSTLIIRDSQDGGKITGGNVSGWNGGGAFFVTYGSTLIIEGGTITGNKSYIYGGGAITATNGSTVRMTGGSITGNVGNTSNINSYYAAGAVCLKEQSHFYLSGGSITGNLCGGHNDDEYGKDDCGGIGFDNDHPKNVNRVHLSGTYTLSDNMLGSYENGMLTNSIASDYLHTRNNVIVIEDAINPTAPAVITVSDKSEQTIFTSGWSSHMSADPATCFTIGSFYNTSRMSILHNAGNLHIAIPEAFYWGADDNHDGTSEEKAYIIKTTDGLEYLSNSCNSGQNFFGVHFKLGNDIDMSSVANFTPVSVFKGHFDGNGKTISGLTVSSPTKTQVGLFGCIDGGSVSNLTLSSATITGQDYVGGIVGTMYNGSIQNCQVVGSTITVNQSSLPCAGAIVGYCTGTLSTNTYHSTLVYVPNYTGPYYNKDGGNAFNIGISASSGVFGDIAGEAELDATKLFLTDGADNSALIAAYAVPAAHTAYNSDKAPSFSSGIDVTLQGRKLWKDGDWNTLCLPFSMTDEQVTAQLAPAALMTLGNSTGCNTGFDVSTGTLTLDFVPANTIEPGVAYIVKWTAQTPDYVENPTFTGVTISNEAPADHGTVSLDKYVEFVGTYSPVPFTAENKSILFLGGGNSLFYPDGKATTTIGAFRTYFKLNDPTANVREFKLNFDGSEDATSIDNGELTIDNGADIYNLAGQMINGKWSKGKLPKGIYIINGKKVLINNKQ